MKISPDAEFKPQAETELTRQMGALEYLGGSALFFFIGWVKYGSPWMGFVFALVWPVIAVLWVANKATDANLP
jgi:hypothetical protein